MVQITEFRIVMPYTMDQYHVGQTYMVTKMQLENTSGNDGVEVISNEKFSNEELGEGQYTHKMYHLSSKAPSWLRAICPSDALKMEEYAWNAYPKCKTTLKCPYFPNFSLEINSIHVADHGTSENVHNLDEEQLKIRKVEILDIAASSNDYWSYMMTGSGIDPATFRSQKAGIGPLQPGWLETHSPAMTAYKLVTVDSPYWGYGYRMEQMVLSAERAVFLASHQKVYGWMDDWFKLTVDDLRAMEKASDRLLNQRLQTGEEAMNDQDSSTTQIEGSDVAMLQIVSSTVEPVGLVDVADVDGQEEGRWGSVSPNPA